jgi:hypothetical protein
LIKIIRDASLIVVTATIFFALINFFSWIYLQSLSESDVSWQGRWQISAGSRKGIEIRKRVLATDDEKYLQDLNESPIIRPHTVLQFVSGTSRSQYTIGIQGIRYEPDWTDDYVSGVLASDQAAFVFGGSTTFGHGVPGDATLVKYLNDADDDYTYLNFGVNAYDSLREVDRLLYLLRQGYRPKRVIFIDGLNDITTFASSPYRSHDKPRTQGFLVERGELALMFGYPSTKNMLMAFAYAMPITHLYFRLTEQEFGLEYRALDVNIHPLDYHMIAYYYDKQFENAEKNIEFLVADWVDYYSENIRFVESLAEVFGFEVQFVFQPFGVIDRGNPFLNPEFFESSGIDTAVRFTDAASKAISAGELDMADCQDAFETIDRTMGYVDPTHYSPLGNRAMADCILRNQAN